MAMTDNMLLPVLGCEVN